VPPDTLSMLTLLAEVLAINALPGSFELISRLLDILNKLVQYVSLPHVDLSYIQQLLMTAVENSASKILVRKTPLFFFATTLYFFPGSTQCHSKFNQVGHTS
jgi:hypothetical protein